MIDKFVGSCMVICLVLFSEQGFSQPAVLKSPDARITVELKPGTDLASLFVFNVLLNGHSLLLNNRADLSMQDGPAALSAKVIRNAPVRTSWQTVYGERKNIPDNYNSLAIVFTAKSHPAFRVKADLRLYNEGFAFRYTILNNNKPVLLNAENTLFNLPAAAMAWASSTAQGMISHVAVGQVKGEVERPLTIQLNDTQWLALGEAGLADFARMKFAAGEAGGLITRLSGTVSGKDTLASPWRYMMLAASPAQLLQQNYFVLNLNEPCRIRETGWIQPGKVLRETTLTTKGAFASIDFAATHGIRYILFDAGWYGREDHDSSDATRVALDPLRSKGPLDLQAVIQYGNSKNTGVILYVNHVALERQLDTLLPLYEKWGVKGIKFGFVQVGSQRWTNWLHAAIRKAAQYHLLVDIHDEYRPTGYTRTWPNLLTQEGIRGDEESPYTEQTIKTIFTRMIAGPADNTNCYFTARVNKMGSHAAQLAKALCIYSPLNFLFWYDHPSADTAGGFREGVIQEVPELDWYKKLPVVWDASLVLEGTMEGYATIARKKDNTWFVGSLNGVQPRSTSLPLSFLDAGKKYRMVVYQDDPAVASPTHVTITTSTVTRQSVLSFSVGARNGLAAMIEPLH